MLNNYNLDDLYKYDICPICNHELEKKEYHEECHGAPIISEIYKECENCKLYSYEYSYGNYFISIKDKNYCYSYLDEDMSDIFNMVFMYELEKKTKNAIKWQKFKLKLKGLIKWKKI